MLRFLCLIVILVITCSASAQQQPVSPLEQLLLNKKYKEFKREATQATSHGNAEAFFLLGKSYHLGLGVEADEDKALSFYKQA